MTILFRSRATLHPWTPVGDSLCLLRQFACHDLDSRDVERPDFHHGMTCAFQSCLGGCDGTSSTRPFSRCGFLHGMLYMEHLSSSDPGRDEASVAIRQHSYMAYTLTAPMCACLLNIMAGLEGRRDTR